MLKVVLATLLYSGLQPAAAALSPRAAKDLIHNLPGLNFHSPPQFSGYLNATPTRFLHYWSPASPPRPPIRDGPIGRLVESQGKPETDPVLVWFNGGPGCSSLTGMLFENGPFHVGPDNKTLFENVHAWNKIGSVLFLEGPTGVGFSYSQKFNDDATSDYRAGRDFANALNDFFTNVRPDLVSNGFYLTGESYAGVYIPTTAVFFHKGIASHKFKGNLKGVAIGNGILSEKYQHNSVVDFIYFHGLMSKTVWDSLHTNCCHNVCTADCNFYANLKVVDNGNDFISDNTKCGNLSYYVSETLEWHTKNNPYNVYLDCYKKTELNLAQQRANRLYIANSKNTVGDNLVKAVMNDDSTDAHSGFDCWGEAARDVYLNSPAVLAALHIPKALTAKANFTWAGCSDPVFKSYNATELEMKPWFDYLYNKTNIRMLIYNGDVDMVCNFLGDQWFMNNATADWGIDTASKGRFPWFYRTQIGGYVQSYNRIDVATVKGAGHFVPTSRPGPMLQLLANFVWETGNYSKPDGSLPIDASTLVGVGDMIPGLSVSPSPSGSSTPAASLFAVLTCLLSTLRYN